MLTTTERFLEAWINAEHKVLGRTLAPLCLRHLMHLYAVKSPLVITDMPVNLSDLELAVDICSSTSDAGMAFLRSATLSQEEIKSLQEWRAANLARDPKEEALAFIAYQDDYLNLTLPETYEKEGGKGGECVLPWLLMHAAALVSSTKWSEETVFNMPIGKVLWWNHAFSYLKSGETNILGDKDIEAQQALAALKAGTFDKEGAK